VILTQKLRWELGRWDLDPQINPWPSTIEYVGIFVGPKRYSTLSLDMLPENDAAII
jgi:hypothetical protein